MGSRYHIVYPRGDRTKLTVVEIEDAVDYEFDHYAVASRKSFDTYKESANYAKGLSDKNGLTFIPNTNEEPDYLD